MPNHSTLRELVDTVALKIDAERPERYFTRLWPFAVSGLQELGFSGAGGHSLKTILLDVGVDRVATLPDDYLEWVAVGQGFSDAAGTRRVRNLAYGPSLNLHAGYEPFLDPAPLDAPVDTAWPAYQYFGWDGASLCGYGYGEYREEFRIDPKDRVLRVSSLIDAADPLVFQYLSSDSTPTAGTPLHPFLHRPLECYILSEWWSHKQNWTASAQWMKKYLGAKTSMQKRFDPSTREGIQEAISSAYSLSVK
ncbi:hypothetical protein [Hymenobacter glacieicola]|uniref:Uncharacterized protein n=1 Tax=Hymenobacter glacieicola TaxID=1562124 RepID=A0ABQ1X5R9_9BACT|nr:hypothetical protein [Hymenobacter glacieicola]GGG61283.1 hypothetical protein GCM10011378_41640 [Hymenobacter glacieicola]